MADDAKTEDTGAESFLVHSGTAREEAEHRQIEVMFEANTFVCEPVDEFSKWLLLGTLGAASVMVVNADKLIFLLSRGGFVACAALVLLSSGFGVASRYFALLCRLGIAALKIGEKTIKNLVEHQVVVDKIQRDAEFWRFTVQTEVRLPVVFKEWLKPWPGWFQRRVQRKMAKAIADGGRHAAHHQIVHNLLRQSLFMSAHMVAIFLFLAVALTCAAVNVPTLLATPAATPSNGQHGER